MEHVPVSFDWWRCGGTILKRSVPTTTPSSVCSVNNQHSLALQVANVKEEENRTVATHQCKCQCFSNEWPRIYKQGEPAVETLNRNRNDRGWPFVGCEVDEDYWYDPKEDSSIVKARRLSKRHGYGQHVVGVRPPWCPAKIPTDCCGLSKIPPLYQRYCRSRDKPIIFITRP